MSRRDPIVENDAYAGFMRRAVRAYGRRVGDGDLPALADLVKLRDLVDDAIREGAQVAHERHGYSWTEIAAELGVSRQAARQRFTRKAGEGS